MYQDPPVPGVRIVLRHSRLVVALAALAPLLTALLFMLPDFNWRIVLFAIAASAACGFLMQCFVDVLRIIAETLLPR